MIGYIHSFQSMGAVDGPGLRCVVFMQGCPLRCCYCHNPDSWQVGEGQPVTPEQLMEKILRFRPYFGKTGGVTVSGGEPLMQAEFVARLFALLKEQGIHTALDTCGHGPCGAVQEVLAVTDLVLCDVKFPTEEGYQTHCKGSLEQTLWFLEQVSQQAIPLWIRHVVVPGLTDGAENIKRIHAIAKEFPTLQKLELLPFKKLCQEKYDTLAIPFPLQNTPECSPETIAALNQKIQSWEK